MDKAERLLNLAAALKAADRPLTREELRERVPGYAEDFSAFRRTFERDKESLRAMGIPITVGPVDPSDPSSPEGYRIRAEEYELPDPGLEPDELAALHLAAAAVHLEGGEATAALWKLGGTVAGEAGTAAIAIAGSEHLPLLFAAVSERRSVRFQYRDAERMVDPWRLAFRHGRWYLAGWDHDRGEERQFRLDRMERPAAAGAAGSARRPAGPPADPPPRWAMGDEEMVEALLLVDDDQAVWATGFLGADRIAERGDDGSVVFRLAVTNRAAFRDLVLSFLDHAEVLGPAELRNDVIGWLEALA